MEYSATAVIGAGYGDEGKGLITNIVCNHQENPMVVRFNGGAQAGHTVVSNEGHRHVFGHLGSGTFAGAPTYLAEEFIVNPIIFRKEYERFIEKYNITPKVFVHPACRVTSPYEMIINQITEEFRGDCRHGSCGMGINETIERNNKFMRFWVRTSPADVAFVLNNIRSCWLKKRLLQNGVNLDMLKDEFLSDAIIEKYCDDFKFFQEHTTVADYDILRERNVVFEGAQGLLLDQYHENFPHVTRSSTGIENVCAIANKIGLKDLNVIYATRWYVTRHGRGQMLTEVTREQLSPRIEDKTNIFNMYQENLRFGYLDLNYLMKTIKHDLSKNAGVNVHPNLAVTCLDQTETNLYSYMLNGKLVTTEEFPIFYNLETVRKAEGLPSFVYYSNHHETGVGFSTIVVP